MKIRSKGETMLNNIYLVDYEEKYADEINLLKALQWGEESITDIRKKIGQHTVIKIAKLGEKLIGFGYGKIVGDAFYLQVLMVKENYRHNHVGSLFMDYFINYAKNKNLSNIVCEGVLTNGNMNIENMMKKYNFKEMLRIREYWGYLLPDSRCEACESKPCKCTNVIFVKELVSDGK